jgi:pimeloyl-ACP methyl ester carboxylesterase
MTTVPWQDRAPSRKPQLLVWLLLLLPLFVVTVYPTVQDYLRAASLLQRISDPRAAGWIAGYDVHPVDIRDTAFEFRGAPVSARMYIPRGIASPPGIMVVHGMHDLGIDEPRLVGFSRSLAASGFFVMTPQVPGIADYRVEAESAALIGTAAQSFAQQIQAPRVGVLTLSFSGGLALLAASDPQYSPSIGWIATVGAYYDLAHVLSFFATGEAVRPDGSVENITPHGYGPLIVVYDEPQDFFAPRDIAPAREAIRVLLSEDETASKKLAQILTPAGQETMRRIYQQQREYFAAALRAQVDKRKEQLAAASPAGHLESLSMPVLLLHGSDDTVIPPTELLWLQRDIPKDKLLDTLISPAIAHVDVGDKVTLRDRLALIHWMALIIHETRSNEMKAARPQLPAGAWFTSWSVQIQPW